MDLQNAHVLLTGASGGIGSAMAQAFTDAGATVSLAARSTTKIETMASQLGGQAFTVDLSSHEQTMRLVDRVEEAAGPIDVLINNAGIETSRFFHNVDPESISAVARVNLEAPMILTRQVLDGMLERNRGHLVFTSSLAGTGGFPGLVAYGATKAGLSNFASALRIELRDTALGVTVLAPGPVDTAMYDALEESDDLVGVLKRLNMFRLIPTKAPSDLAAKTVAAVTGNRRNVLVPRRLASNTWLREAPSKLTEMLMTGVNVGPKARR